MQNGAAPSSMLPEVGRGVSWRGDRRLGGARRLLVDGDIPPRHPPCPAGLTAISSPNPVCSGRNQLPVPAPGWRRTLPATAPSRRILRGGRRPRSAGLPPLPPPASRQEFPESPERCRGRNWPATAGHALHATNHTSREGIWRLTGVGGCLRSSFNFTRESRL